MTKKELAEIILQELDEVININWNNEEMYIKAILKGLKNVNLQDDHPTYPTQPF